ncbi:hypothetical protein EWB00_000800, partial [Schistosoma japonicum]
MTRETLTDKAFYLGDLSSGGRSDDDVNNQIKDGTILNSLFFKLFCTAYPSLTPSVPTAGICEPALSNIPSAQATKPGPR